MYTTNIVPSVTFFFFNKEDVYIENFILFQQFLQFFWKFKWEKYIFVVFIKHLKINILELKEWKKLFSANTHPKKLVLLYYAKIRRIT